jgi:hypothetical protein
MRMPIWRAGQYRYHAEGTQATLIIARLSSIKPIEPGGVVLTECPGYVAVAHDCAQAWEGHDMGMYLVHHRGSSMCWRWATFKKAFKRWVYKQRMGICCGEQFVNDARVGYPNAEKLRDIDH